MVEGGHWSEVSNTDTFPLFSFFSSAYLRRWEYVRPEIRSAQAHNSIEEELDDS